MVCGQVGPDFVSSMKASRQLAEQGGASSQVFLADNYSRAYDDEDAYYWARVALSNPACKTCTGIAQHVLAGVGKHLNAEQQAAIDKRAAEWKPKHLVYQDLTWDQNLILSRLWNRS
jgi:hypothetical protein